MSDSIITEKKESFSKIFDTLEEFECFVATSRKRIRDADYLDRKLVISDSTEFEKHFENLSEAIARLLPYHTFYVEELKPQKIVEEDLVKCHRKKRIKQIKQEILQKNLQNSSSIFNATKYGLIRVIHSSIVMELERHKKELSQLQALELAWKYPIENNNVQVQTKYINDNSHIHMNPYSATNPISYYNNSAYNRDIIQGNSEQNSTNESRVELTEDSVDIDNESDFAGTDNNSNYSAL
ncbi:hypothetical protein cand_024800 [Cryptosporidium andersoni]|uniref:GLTSCR protein conserved domain-containing protein n=1 Tax=Cryptosporidium andersoni TaxID=117008 RepID=A0A1J4MTN1_9CRYT|nr:hypothetical protein cand_024800 [Cryptosporidium andersoni]